MKTLRKLVLPIVSITIIFSSLLYIGCEGDDENVDDYFDNNPYQGNPDRESFSDAPVSTLSISPSSVRANQNDYIIFSASGGTPPYTWQLKNTIYGDLNKQGAYQATYHHNTTTNGKNVVLVTDTANAIAIANIN